MSDPETKIKSFTQLIAWQESHKLVIMIYKLTRDFPKDEIFGLVSQLRRAVISITSNIAEGFSRQSWKEKGQFFFIALGSLTEIQNQLLAARDIGYLDKKDFDNLAEQTVVANKLINGLIKKAKTYY